MKAVFFLIKGVGRVGLYGFPDCLLRVVLPFLGSAANVFFGSEAAIPLRFRNLAAWGSANGQKRTLIRLRKTRRPPGFYRHLIMIYPVPNEVYSAWQSNPFIAGAPYCNRLA
jgi:hypothetical protein